MYKIVVYVFCVSLLFSGCDSNKRQKHSPNDIPALTYLDQKVASWVDSAYYKGVSMKIVKDDLVFFEANYGGFADTTVQHVASAGKWIAAATIAAVVDEGLLSWDDPVKKYLPEFTDLKGEATLRQLFSHTAGYPDYQPADQRKDDYHTLEESVIHIVGLPADTLPGTTFRYGGLAMQVAGRMAEIVTGKDWETIFQEKIARPLGMDHSHFTPVSEEEGLSPMLGGGYRTCMKDYIHFLNMFMHYGVFEGKRVLSEAAVREIEADQVKDAGVSQPEYVLNARQNNHNGIYGLGMWREELDAEGNVTLMSSPGWVGTYPWIDRKNNVYGIIVAKISARAARNNGFDSFYESAVLPLIVRDAIRQESL